MANIGQANVFHEFIEFPRFWAGLRTQEILWKTINSWKTLARPMFSIVFSQEFTENIGQANVFHEFLDFPRFWAGPRRFFGKP